jgi:molecular chaperone DnaK (HSP70)
MTNSIILFRLTELDVHDRELLALLTAKNNLESFIYEMRDKLEHDTNYKAATTPEDQTTISDKLTEVDTWLGDDGYDADVKVIIQVKYLSQFMFYFFYLDIKIEIR